MSKDEAFDRWYLGHCSLCDEHDDTPINDADAQCAFLAGFEAGKASRETVAELWFVRYRHGGVERIAYSADRDAAGDLANRVLEVGGHVIELGRSDCNAENLLQKTEGE